MATVNNEDPRMVSHEQMLRRGLRVAQAHVGNQKHKAVIGDFKSHYGIHPKQCARVWKDLIERNIIEDGEEDLLGFFAALSFLKEYDREKKRRGIFKMNVKPLRELTWRWVEILAALKPYKIVWPSDDEWVTTFIISVDGTHRRTNEPRHPEVRKHGSYYSHKFHKAGINHEVALHLFKQNVVHAKNFDLGSEQDKTIFKKELLQKIPPGKRVVCDNGYEGLPDIFSAYNQFDTEQVKWFKNRAKSRHESFNNLLIKTFQTTVQKGL